MENKNGSKTITAIVIGALGLVAMICGASTTVTVCSDGCSTSANGGLVLTGITLIAIGLSVRFGYGQGKIGAAITSSWIISILALITIAVLWYQSVNTWVIMIGFMMGGFIVVPLVLIGGLVLGITATNRALKRDAEAKAIARSQID